MTATAPSSLTHRRAASIAAGMLCIATWPTNFSRFGCLWQYSCAPFVVGMRQRRRVVRREVVVHQDLPPARAVHDSDVDAVDIHGGQGRLRVEAAPARDLEVWGPRAAQATQLASGRGGGRRLAMRGNRQTLHLHPHDGIGVTFVLGAIAEFLLLPAEEPRQARSMWPFEVPGPEIVRRSEERRVGKEWSSRGSSEYQ